MRKFDLDGFEGYVAENPKVSVPALIERVRTGAALVVWYSGISKSDERELKKDALEFVKCKKCDIQVHFVFFGDCLFQIIE